MATALILLTIVVILAVMFDFVNGFHDAANTISTIVVTRTMTPLAAVIMAGCANFTGFWFGTAVAKTVGKGVVNTKMITDLGATVGAGNEILLHLLLGALCGAVAWNIFTWLLGLPTSSSHALIGGLMGSGIACAGFGVVNWGHGSIHDLINIISHAEFKKLNETFGVLTIFAFIIIAPLLGYVVSVIFTGITIWVCHKMNPRKADKGFKALQVVSSIFASIAHGTNDAQKSMGVIAMAMVAANAYASDAVKLTMDNVLDIHKWIAITCYTAISMGTMFGGWRIVKTMGTQITKVHPMEGFTSSTSAAAAISVCSNLGIPVSTTHVIAGSIMGVGSIQGSGKVRWVTARKIVWAWFMTIPAAATVAAISYTIIAKVLG